jgi:hypothetical protein
MCALYVVPGLIGRDPWRYEDATGFGVAWTMAFAGSGPADWLMPNVLGVPLADEGPVPFWLGAIAMRALPVLPPDAVMRGVTMAWLALFLLNRDLEQDMEVSIDARNFGKLKVAEAEELHHADLKAINTKDHPLNVKPAPLAGVTVDGGQIQMKLKPASWTVIRLAPA